MGRAERNERVKRASKENEGVLSKVVAAKKFPSFLNPGTDEVMR